MSGRLGFKSYTASINGCMLNSSFSGNVNFGIGHQSAYGGIVISIYSNPFGFNLEIIHLGIDQIDLYFAIDFFIDYDTFKAFSS